MNEYAQLNHTVIVQSEEHQELAIQMALKSFVLLKNNGSYLPLSTRFNKIAVSRISLNTFVDRHKVS